MGWSSQPETRGFALVVGGQEKLRFDVTSSLSRWEAPDGSMALFYLPTWSSEVDSGGFFFLVLGGEVARRGGKVSFGVRSLGTGSKRWFAIDTEQRIGQLLPRVSAALKPLHR